MYWILWINSFILSPYQLLDLVVKLILLFIQVASLQFGDFYDMQYVRMYTIFMVQLQVFLITKVVPVFSFITLCWFFCILKILIQNILPPSTNIPDAYANGSSDEQVHFLFMFSSEGMLLKVLNYCLCYLLHTMNIGYALIPSPFLVGIYSKSCVVLHFLLQGSLFKFLNCIRYWNFDKSLSFFSNNVDKPLWWEEIWKFDL